MAKTKFFVDIDLNGNQLLQHRLENLPAPPAPLGVGHVYWDTVLNDARIWNGASWIGFSTISLPDLVDTDFSGWTGADDKQYLIYDSTTFSWKPSDIFFKIKDANDTNIDSPADLQVLTYDTVTAKWIASDSQGGVGINNAGEYRFVLSGDNAAANLEAQELVTYHAGIMDVGSTEVGTGIRTISHGNPALGQGYGGLGMKGGVYSPDGFEPYIAGMKSVAAETHTATALGTILQFVNTKIGSSAPFPVFHISGNGGIYVKPIDTYASSDNDFHINGSFSRKQHTVPTTVNGYNLDTYGWQDSFITVWRDSTAICIIDVPLPAQEISGRELWFKLAAPAKMGEIKIVCNASGANVFYDSGFLPNITKRDDGDVIHLVCTGTGSDWLWMIM